MRLLFVSALPREIRALDSPVAAKIIDAVVLQTPHGHEFQRIVDRSEQRSRFTKARSTV